MSKIMRGQTIVRPSWDYPVPNLSTCEVQRLEMLESVRNAVEELAKSQMLQCDVAEAIKAMAADISKMRIAMDRKRRRRRAK